MIRTIRTKHWQPHEAKHAAGAWEALDAGYGDPKRAYHSWRHIADLMEKLDRFSCLAVRKDLVAIACFWHDAVYVTRDEAGAERSDELNVRESADLFQRYAVMNPADVDAVTDLIMATTDHMGAEPRKQHYPGFSGDFDLLLDLDLSSLGAHWPEFKANYNRIRFEYEWLPESIFNERRLRSLESFARAGAGLFRRAETREEYGASAAANLARYIRELGQGPAQTP